MVSLAPRPLNILLLSPYLPCRDTTACARKIYDSIRSLRKRGHGVYLFSFCSRADAKRAGALKDLCGWIYLENVADYSRFPRRARGITREIVRLCKSAVVDVLQCENSYLCRYLPPNPGIPRVLVEHEILSLSFKERSCFEKRLFHKLIWYFRSRKKTFEQRNWYGRFDKIVVFCREDRAAVSRDAGADNIEVVPLGIFRQEYLRTDTQQKSRDIIFAGNFSHYPNVDAAFYLVKEILPLIRQRLPEASLVIAGANPPDSLKKISLSEERVSVTGYLEDIGKTYAETKVAVAPIRFGTGMRFKVLEALAVGVPVVATSIGARGFSRGAGIVVRDSKESFRDAVVELINNPDMRRDMQASAWDELEKNHDWDELICRYENIYNGLLNSRANDGIIHSRGGAHDQEE